VWITDTRPCAPAPTRLLTGHRAEILLRCDSAQNVPALVRHLRGTVDESGIRAALAELDAQKLVVEMEGHYGSLPVIRKRRPQATIGVSNAPIKIPAPTPAEPLLRVI